MSELIDLHVLGGVNLQGPDGSELETILSGPKRLAVLAYLAVESFSGRHRRDTLLGLFWPELDQEHARASLRNVVHVLRRSLGDGVIVSRGDDELSVERSRLWCDAVAFVEALKAHKPADALSLYRGELLQGLYVAGAPEFERWLEEERTDLRSKASEAAWALVAEQEAEGSPGQAAKWARRAIAFSPYDEDALRRALEMLARIGDHAGAIALYEEFARRLAKDLEMEPAPETRSLVARLRTSGTSGAFAERAGKTRDSRPSRRASKFDSNQITTADSDVPEAVETLTSATEPSDVAPRQWRLPYNVPSPPTTLVGRDEELELIGSLLRDPKTRLLTLTGAPGTGKTRLALSVAAAMADQFRDGVAVVFLASVTGDERVAPAMAHALGLRDDAPGSALDRLKEYLGSHEVLVVLDNFEQVLGASSVVAELLAACPGLKLVVTSRAALRVRGEQDFVVPPLKLPSVDDASDTERLRTYPAVQLFVERARSVRASFAMREGNAGAIAEICRQLDGLPLAVELAAARVKMFPPALILERLRSRLDFLTEGPRDLPAHQRTIRTAIDWSYNLLSEAEQRLFRRLGVFVDSFALEGVEAIAPDVAEVTENLSSLLDKSLVTRSGPEDGDPRYSMLATIREYACERLADEGEAEDGHVRHAAFYVTLAENADPALRSQNQAEWLHRLESEHENLRAALAWGRDHDRDLAARIACALSRFWSARGYLAEGREWLEQVVEDMEGIAPTLQVRVLNSAGVLANSQADYRRAIELWERALALGRVVGNTYEISRSLTNLAGAYVQRGDPDAATEVLVEALATCGDEKGMRAAILGNLGYVKYVQGDSGSGKSLWEACLQLHREIGDTNNTLTALNNLTWSLLSEGEADQAEKLVEEALALSRQLGTSTAGCQLLENMAWIADIRGQHEKAVSLNKEALKMALRSGGPRQVVSIIRSLGALALKEGQVGRATHLYAASASIADEHEFHGSTLLEEHRFEGNVATLRARMGDAAFERIWTEGRAMSLDEAVELGLGQAWAPQPRIH